MKRKKFYKKAFYGIASVLLFSNTTRAQEEVQLTPMDSLGRVVQKIQSDVDILKKIKTSGYVQAQFQVADSVGVKSFAGGDFPANVDKRFAVRRGRFKIAYNNKLTLYTIQVDVTEKGVGIKDAYVKITDPWTNAFSLTTGVFDRPFGFEMSYSSSVRETPERSRLFQTIFPDEREVGAKLTFQLPKTSAWHPLKIEGGMFNGSGPKVVDFDYQKDFIGNIHWNQTLANEKITFGVGASYYDGGWTNGTKFVYNNMSSLPDGNTGFQVDSTASNKNAISKRTYLGFDGQASIDWIGGITTVRGEYIQGQQPGTDKSTASPSAQPTANTYIRNFSGAYFYFLQNIMQTKHQLIVKYDWYDPNANVSGDEIGKAQPKTKSNLSSTDLKYTTLGLGWAYRLDANVKITAYYDMVTNETSANLSGYTQDLKDNVFTLRVQYKF